MSPCSHAFQSVVYLGTSSLVILSTTDKKLLTNGRSFKIRELISDHGVSDKV